MHWTNLGSTSNFRDAAATTSDHPPLILTLKPHDHSFKRTFKFEIFWLSHSDIHGIVRQAWESVPQYTNSAKRFLTKIKSTQTAITKWAQLKFRNKDNFLTRSTWAIQQLDRVEEYRNLNALEMRLRIKLREHVFRWANEKETKWKQRSGCRWLQLGDNNTRYFHAIANRRKNNNHISMLLNDDDS
ncbi:uncharacterized protein LOC144573718 [Carex rostrata]